MWTVFTICRVLGRQHRGVVLWFGTFGVVVVSYQFWWRRRARSSGCLRAACILEFSSSAVFLGSVARLCHTFLSNACTLIHFYLLLYSQSLH